MLRIIKKRTAEIPLDSPLDTSKYILKMSFKNLT